MKDDRNYIGCGNNDSNFYWPNKSKLALQFVLNYEEGAENSIMNGGEGSETFLSEIINAKQIIGARNMNMESIYCLLYTSPSPRDREKSRMPSSA